MLQERNITREEYIYTHTHTALNFDPTIRSYYISVRGLELLAYEALIYSAEFRPDDSELLQLCGLIGTYISVCSSEFRPDDSEQLQLCGLIVYIYRYIYRTYRYIYIGM
jgi:hypothetical protein